MMNTIERRNERGVALVLALMVMAMLTIMAMGALYTATRSIEIAGSGRYNMQAFYVADSGVARTVNDLLEYYASNDPHGFPLRPSFNINEMNDPTDGLGEAYDADLDDDTAPRADGTPITWVAMQAMDHEPTLAEWSLLENIKRIKSYTPGQTCVGRRVSDSACDGMYYEVWYYVSSTASSVRVLSLAKLGDGDEETTDDPVDAALEIIIRVEDNSQCDFALNASGSASNAVINGNVSVMGGVNILCDGIDLATCPGTDDCTAMDPGGNAQFNNNYDCGGCGGAPGFIDQLDELAVNESGFETYEAEFRVRNCNVDFGGSATVGTSDVPYDRVLVDGGFGDYGSTSIPGNVYAAESVEIGAGSYEEAFGTPSFPDMKVNDALPLSGTPPDANLTELGQGLVEQTPKADLGGTDAAWCTINENTPDLFYPPSATCTCGTLPNCDDKVTTGCEIFYDSSPTAGTGPGDSGAGVKTIHTVKDQMYDFSNCSGTVSIGNDVGPRENYEYTGRGTFYYGDNDLLIDGNVGVASGLTYPSGGALGFITMGDMDLGPSANLEIMGLFYSEGTVSIQKQTRIAGTVITKQFDLSSQVPEIYQVPNIDAYCPAAFCKICQPNERLAPGTWRLVY